MTVCSIKGEAGSSLLSSMMYIVTLLLLHSVLQAGLRFSICGLETSYLKNSQVVGLAKKVKENIPSHLLYSCRF